MTVATAMASGIPTLRKTRMSGRSAVFDVVFALDLRRAGNTVDGIIVRRL